MSTGTLVDGGAHSLTWAPTRAQARILRFYPSLTDFAFAIPAFVLLVIFPHGASNLLGDGDTGWHIRTGEWILQHHAVPTVDIFSFTKTGQPWFAWEWGWDVLAALVHQWAGISGIVFSHVALLCTVSALLFQFTRKVCNNGLVALTATAVAMQLSTIHWLARPHLLSWLFFLLLLRVLWDAENGHPRRLFCLPALVVVWTNIHGSFFVAPLMAALSAIGLTATGRWRQSKPFWATTILCSIATLVNPYTWHVHEHIYRYLTDRKLLDSIQEFQSMSFHHFPAPALELFLLPLGAVVAWCFRRKDVSAGLALLLWAHMALVSARNVPLFGFVACPFIAAAVVDSLAGLRQNTTARLLTGILRVESRMAPFEKIKRVYAPSAALLLLCGVAFAAPRSGDSPFQAKFPASFPANALPVVEKYRASRIFTTDQWGDFFLYHCYPSATVFVDGRSDFYGTEFLQRCRNILQARWDWEQDLIRFSADMVVIPPDAALGTVLKTSPHWRLLLDDRSVLVFARPRTSGGETNKVSPVLNGGNELEAASAVKLRT